MAPGVVVVYTRASPSGSVWMPAMVPSIWPVLRLTLVMVADWPGTVCGAVFTGSIGTTTVMSTVPLLPSSAVMMMVVVWGAPGVAALWRVWGVGVQVKVSGLVVSKSMLVSRLVKVTGSPSGSVTMFESPVTMTAPVTVSAVPTARVCVGSMTGG